MLSLPQPFFDDNPVGRMTTRVTNDVNSINEMYTSVLVQFCKDLLVIVGILIVMFFLNKELTLIMFIFTLIVGYVAVKFRMRLKSVYRKVRISIAKLNAYVQESVSGIILIKLYSREKSNLDRFKEVNNENYRANMDQLFAFATFRPVIECISVLSVGLILWYGGRNVISLNLSLGALIAFLYYTRMLFRPIQELAEEVVRKLGVRSRRGLLHPVRPLIYVEPCSRRGDGAGAAGPPHAPGAGDPRTGCYQDDSHRDRPADDQGARAAAPAA